MKLAIAANYFGFASLEQCLDDIKARGLQLVEMPCGGYCGKAYCDPEALLADSARRRAWMGAFTQRGLKLDCLSVQGNYLHPDAKTAKRQQTDLCQCIDLAAMLELDHIVAFSGLPAGCEEDRCESWPVSGICDSMYDIYTYQWEKKLIPFWRRMGKYAKDRGVKIAIEMHSGMSVHTPHTLLKLRDATCDFIGANVDTAHLWWQGIDPANAIAILAKAGCLYHVHLRDMAVLRDNKDLYGLTGSYPPQDVRNRGWVFAAIGYGHSISQWREIFQALRDQHYQGTAAIEYSDPMIPLDTGLNRTISFCKELMTACGAE